MTPWDSFYFSSYIQQHTLLNTVNSELFASSRFTTCDVALHAFNFHLCTSQKLCSVTCGSALVWVLFCKGFMMILDAVQERGMSYADVRWGDSEECRFPLFSALQALSLRWMYMVYLVLIIGKMHVQPFLFTVRINRLDSADVKCCRSLTFSNINFSAVYNE